MPIRKVSKQDKRLLIITGIIFLCMVLGGVVYNHIGYKIIEAVYKGEAIGFLNNIIKGQTDYSLDYYLKTADKVFFGLNIFLCIGIFLLILFINQQITSILVILSIMGSVSVLLCTSLYGIGLSADSVNYISCARNLLLGNGYLSYTDAPLTWWPPLFPTLLAIIGAVDINTIVGIRFINALLFGLIIFISGQLFLRHIRSKAFAILGIISVLLSYSLLSVHVMVWSEPVFILLVVLFIIYLSRFLDKQNFSLLFLISVLAALSILQRYAGMILVLTGLGLIFFSMSKVSVLQRLKYAIFFTTISLTPIAIWSIRNYILTSNIMLPRGPSTYTFSQNAFSLFKLLTKWFLPSTSLFFVVLISVGLFISIIIAFWHKPYNPIKLGSSTARVTAIFVLIYIISQIAVASIIHMDGVDDRYLAPIYIFVIFVIFNGIEVLAKLLNKPLKKKKLRSIGIIFLCVLWSMFLFCRLCNQIVSHRQFGLMGYNSVAWRESLLIQWLKTHRLKGKIYSSHPDALYILAGITAKIGPDRNKDKNLFAFKKQVESNKPSYLVWFNPPCREYLYRPIELASIIDMEEIRNFPDGKIYILKGAEK